MCEIADLATKNTLAGIPLSELYKYDWDYKDWENFVLQLVRERHGASNVQRVPDKDRGDLGIEAFTFDGRIYQCYAPEFPIATSERTKKLKAKLGQDVPKMLKYAAQIQKLLGSIAISRWILAVPLLDSKNVLEKCQTETDRVAQANLSFIAHDFRVVVVDQSDFFTEIEQLRRKAAINFPIVTSQTTDVDIQGWHDANLEIAEIILGKLQRGFPNDDNVKNRKRAGDYIRWHIDGAEVLDQLRRDMPDLWDSLRAATTNAERTLVTLGSNGGGAREILIEQIEHLRGEISGYMTGFHTADIDHVAFGTVADWLMRCPLDFPEK